MRFLSAWTEAGTATVVLVLITPVLLAVTPFIPGRQVARLTAALLAAAVLALGIVGLDATLRWGWAALWILVAWRVGRPAPHPRLEPAPRPSGIESGLIGLLLALALGVLLVSAVARQDLDPAEARSTSFGLLLLVVGLLHLMMRRDAMRALLAFATLGLGVQVLQAAARDTLLTGGAGHPESILLASGILLAVTDKVIRARQESAGSPWVSDAHDLHD
jgi:hypothetical protein